MSDDTEWLQADLLRFPLQRRRLTDETIRELGFPQELCDRQLDGRGSE